MQSSSDRDFVVQFEGNRERKLSESDFKIVDAIIKRQTLNRRDAVEHQKQRANRKLNVYDQLTRCTVMQLRLILCEFELKELLY